MAIGQEGSGSKRGQMVQHNGKRFVVAPTPSLYEVLDTHQRSENHEIRGQCRGNSHVLEFVKKG